MKGKAVLLILGATLLFASSAQARCNTSCLNHKIAALQTKVTQLTRTVKTENAALSTLSGRLTSLSGTVAGQGGSLSGLSGSLNGLSGKVDSLSGSLTSLSGKVDSLSGTVTSAGQLLACIGEVPVTEYGDPAGSFGYSYFDGMTSFDTTALDITAPGDPVGAWSVIDSCNTTPTASPAARGILGPEAHIAARGTSK